MPPRSTQTQLPPRVAELTAVVFAPAHGEPEVLAALAVECARVGAGAVRLPAGDDDWLAASFAAITAATELVVLPVSAAPHDLLLGADPVPELARALDERDARELVVGGPAVSALLAGLAAGTHLRAGSADTPGACSTREEVQLVARAAALARLAGRVPMTPAEIRACWPSSVGV